MSTSRRGIPLGVVLLFTGIIGLFNIIIATTMISSTRLMARLVPIEATVVSTEVTSHISNSTSSRGTTSSTTMYTPVITYTYKVRGQDYTSDRRSYMDVSRNDHAWAESIINEHPPGSKIPAYIDPLDPQTAFLVHEETGMPPLLILFMMPFNVGVCFMWWGWIVGRRKGTDEPVAGGLVPIDDGNLAIIRPRPPKMLAVFLIAFGLCCFLAMFILAVATDMDASMSLVTWVLTGIFAFAISLALLVTHRASSPLRELRFDRSKRLFEVAAMTAPTEIGPASGEDGFFRLDEISHLSLTSDQVGAVNNVPTYLHVLRLNLKSGRSYDAFRFRGNQERADLLTAWLTQETGLALGSPGPTGGGGEQGDAGAGEMDAEIAS